MQPLHLASRKAVRALRPSMHRDAVLSGGGEPSGGSTVEVVVVFGGTNPGDNAVGSDEPSGEATMVAYGLSSTGLACPSLAEHPLVLLPLGVDTRQRF